MATDWHLLADVGGFAATLATFIGFGMKQARVRGVQDQTLKEVVGVVKQHTEELRDHNSQLADGAGNFKVVDTKLDFIKDTIKSMAAKLDRHCEGDR